MSPEQQRLHAYLNAVFRQFGEVRAIVSTGLNNRFPLEVAIELQHMLMHLVSAHKCSGSDYLSKIHQISSALGHVDRAYLDACKVLVHEKFPSLKNSLPFMQGWASARQAEGKGHSHDRVIHNDNIILLERGNPICERYKKLLLKQGLITVPKVTGAHGTWSNWTLVLPEVEEWLGLDLFFNSLYGRKHLEALQVMLLSFMEMDNERLHRLNLQIMLDTLSMGAIQAERLGWGHFGKLKPHQQFITEYTKISPWQERDVTDQQDWIRSIFNELRTFYVNP